MRLILVLLAVLVSWPGWLHARKVVPAQPQGARPASFVVKPLREIALYPEREASAQVVTLNESRVAAEIAGRIVSIDAQAGERIQAGARIARIECRDHELAAERAGAAIQAGEARLAFAASQRAQAKALQARGYLSPDALAGRNTEVRVLRADIAVARAQYDTARRAVGRCTVRAPFNAIVRQRLGHVGEWAAPGTPLVLLTDADNIEVVAQVQESDVTSLSAVKEQRFVGEGGELPLSQVRISPLIDPQARTVEVRLRFKAGAAAPGAAGRMLWRDPRAHIPAGIIVRRSSGLGIFLARDGHARFHPLPRAQEGRPARADLPLSAPVVVSGQQALQDGALLATPAR